MSCNILSEWERLPTPREDLHAAAESQAQQLAASRLSDELSAAEAAAAAKAESEAKVLTATAEVQRLQAELIAANAESEAKVLTAAAEVQRLQEKLITAAKADAGVAAKADAGVATQVSRRGRGSLRSMAAASERGRGYVPRGGGDVGVEVRLRGTAAMPSRGSGLRCCRRLRAA